MCVICGQLYCPTNCPEYDPREDPWNDNEVYSLCKVCKEIIFSDSRICKECEERLDKVQNTEIEFDPVEHVYTVDGKTVPCVSDIIAVFGKDIDEGDDLELKMDAAADRGTTCHKVIEMYLRHMEPEYPDEYEPYVDAIRLFLSEHKIQPIFIEQPIYSAKHNYAGTPDLLCFFDGYLTLIDYKFVSQIAKTKVKAQLNAYCKAYEEQEIYPEFLYAVQFLKDGTYRLYPVKYDDTELEVALNLWDLKHKKHPRGEIT